ncbi:MAG: sulfate adenylyltransferase subunit CysN [Bacteroidales bacterium]|nr:sulfate adenylyltransferase subunit CysN [Bacteroidales bacterium]
MDKNINIKEFLDKDEQKDLLRLLTAGSVDDGKSTLIGRLLFDSKKLYEDQLDALEKDSKRVGNAGAGEIDYALLLDGLKAEREQGITIDVAYRYFSTNKRKFIIADTPGHEQYTRNMITGGSTANLAIILIDARTGVITQTKRHTFLVSLLGIKHVVLAVNKMDLVDYDENVFNKIVDDYKSFVTRLDIPDIKPIPMSALKGDNVVEVSDKMPWYNGESLLDFLENVHIGSDYNYEDFRYPVQYVLRPNLDFRGFSAKVASGIVRKGDEIMALPSGKRSKVKGIHVYEGEIEEAFPPMSVTLTLEDEIDISRGEMIVHPNNQPSIDRHFEAVLVWMDEEPMDVKKQFFIKQTTNTTKVRIDEIRYKIDVNTLEQSKVDNLSLNEIGRAVLTTNKPLLFDSYKKNKSTGSFILIDPISNNTSAVGMIIEKLNNKDLPSRINDIDRVKAQKGLSLISTKEREERLGQKGQTIWITGLAGSGKKELAYIIERRLFDEGKTVVVLDGSSVRSGLSQELDFTPADRAENLRRVAHISRLLNDQGIITICAFRSPDSSIREQVKEIIGKNRFTLIYMNETLDACKNRQPELYKLAEEGKKDDIPGIDVKYDIPDDADYKINLSEINRIEDLIKRI